MGLGVREAPDVAVYSCGRQLAKQDDAAEATGDMALAPRATLVAPVWLANHRTRA